MTISPGKLPPEKPPEDHLDSWKEIAAYLNRGVTTVQRWEKREGMPVHRHLHGSMVSTWRRAERQLTNFAPDFNISDFDISPDGHEVVLERVQDFRTWCCWTFLGSLNRV